MVTTHEKTIQRVLSVALCLLVLLYVLPYVWMITTSFKPDSELFAGHLFPSQPTLLQYERLLVGYQAGDITVEFQYPRYYINSAFVTVLSVLFVLTFDALAAFAFAKYQFKGKRILFWLMIMTMMLPVYATIIPSFYLFSRILQWVNKYQSLIIPGVVDAYGIFLLTQYMKSIPSELIDAARMDGAGPLRVFWYVIVPLTRPALGTLAIFKFLGVWNDYLWPLVMIRDENMYTLTIGIAQMQARQGMVVWGVQMAAAALATIPVVILVFAMQKQFLRGFTAGAIKA
jgi:ABC-type glycerol-3-phosphate transport system permease component